MQFEIIGTFDRNERYGIYPPKTQPIFTTWGTFIIQSNNNILSIYCDKLQELKSYTMVDHLDNNTILITKNQFDKPPISISLGFKPAIASIAKMNSVPVGLNWFHSEDIFCELAMIHSEGYLRNLFGECKIYYVVAFSPLRALYIQSSDEAREMEMITTLSTQFSNKI